ncbi:S-methyl-5'-thioadenosine phosphorylase [Haliangium ochraceum]|uniref:S-methyl-5'-thioadenosine phosphorylase n=1 Tax=Haliangium ochraceum (strain DSM 14365 / JCM 11303 / SMP-2) TaxID=502025 RepID=D0LNX5_HALO1|nr:S-methyl-5'-thioadenosine phosphorylase [Haliangium ochraceum]ACY18801.1 methylthioadenosine phosphorylase [Haliangium ochraceum DSM 14365]
MAERVIGVIGGSGIYGLDSLSEVEEVEIHTPFGSPSGKLLTGRLDGVKMAFLARHDRGHRLLPSEINYRANIYALKSVGVQWLLSLSAVGSMREEIRPGDMVVVDQFFDRTQNRASTFFGDGIVAHVSMADPISPMLADALYAAASHVAKDTEEAFEVHRGGTYMVMNGPQFSTRAESRVYRSWGVDVIGMTNMPEAKLAREAEISYATLAMATDYDCWHETEEDVNVESVIAIVRRNATNAARIVAEAVRRIPAEHTCIAADALKNAIMTDPARISVETKRRLAPIIKKYIS